ncbi:redoxin domain-containing protein [Planctomycetaceae bacterium SH139]
MRTTGPMHSFLTSCLLVVVWTTTAFGQEGDLEPEIPPALLQMSRDSAIHRELKLSPDQVEQALAVTDRIDAMWWPSRNYDPTKQRQVVRRLTDELRAAWLQILDEEQRVRLRQLERQALGTRMMLSGDVADFLRLSLPVRERIKQTALETDSAAKKLQKELQAGEKLAVINDKLAAVKKKELSTVVAQLSPEQQKQFPELVGAPFDFSKIRRSNPRAPELIGQSTDWLQGGPLKLSQLRGKVVVLHFYAFQCINCRRNLPHYNGWFNDFSSEDLVVIGIQSPETSAERDPSRVKAALTDEGVKYPILFDGEAKNWQAWGNTMWPTVYIIDRDGFIRTWWQGELNWQGAEGEQQVREMIRKLAEQS